MLLAGLMKILKVLFKRNRLQQVLLQKKEHTRTEPEFVNLLRGPGIDSPPGGIDSLESISWLVKSLQLRAPNTGTVHAICSGSASHFALSKC